MNRKRALQERVRQNEPEVLTVIGEESHRKGTDKLTSRQIDRIIKETRAAKSKSRKPDAGG
jgi:hypothetical protein